MAFTQYTNNPAVVTQLPKYPSASGYTWEQVRAAFDVDNVAFKAWFNGTHLPEMEVFLATGLNPTGEYNVSTTYPIRSIVTYSGSAYVTLQEVTGVTPTDDGVNYVILVEKGDTPTTFSYNNLTEVPTTFTPTSHAHGNITNDGKIGSTADLPVFTTTAGTVTTKTASQARTALGVASMYEKIMDVADASSGTNTLSIDVSTITFSNYIKVWIVGEISQGTAGNLLCDIRLNNDSNAYYKTGYLNGAVGGGAAQFTPIAKADSGTYTPLDVKVYSPVSGFYAAEWYWHEQSSTFMGALVAYYGYYQFTLGALTSINFINTSTTGIAIRNASIWGIPK